MRARWGTGAGCRCLHVCEVLPFGVCVLLMDFWNPYKRKKKKTKQAHTTRHYFYSWQFPPPLFSPFSSYTLLQSQVTSLPVFSRSVEALPVFLGPLRTGIVTAALTGGSRQGRPIWGCRRLRAPRLSLGWCSMSNP